jgi:predicted hotdog family 3-hydroxylacyl-ACP dehydratase
VAERTGAGGPELLPHRGTARLLTDVVRWGEDFIEAIGMVQAAHPLAGAARAPCFLGLELGAQAAAALEALGRAASTGDQAPRAGFLVRVHEATFLMSDLPLETPLFVVAQVEGAAPPLAIYRLSVAVDGTTFLRARLSTYRS